MITPCKDTTAHELYQYKSPKLTRFLLSVFEEEEHTILEEF